MSDQIDQQPAPSIRLFINQEIRQIAMCISPRISHLITSLDSLQPSPMDQYPPQQLESINQLFKTITYRKELNNSSICHLNDDKIKYYRCYNCEVSNGSCLCEKCFNDPKHENHLFKIIVSPTNYCDCGNDGYIKKESFCKEHTMEGIQGKTKEVISTLQREEVTLFNREMQFLLYFCLKSKQNVDPNSSALKAEYIAYKTIQIMTEYSCNSFTYQRLIGTLFLQGFKRDYNFLENENILHLLLWQEWKSDNFYKIFAKLLCQLYPYDKIRKKIIIEYFHLHTSEVRNVLWINPLTDIDSQYFLQGKLILKLLKAGIIPPLALNFKFTSIDSTAGCFMQIYKAYRIMHETMFFDEILQVSLKKINFSNFFSFKIIDQQSRAALSIVTKQYLLFLKEIILSLQKIQRKDKAELKIIRQSYAYIKTKEEVYNFCPERTLFCCVFSYFQVNLQKLHSSTLEEIMEILGENSVQDLRVCLQKMLQGFFNLYRIENYNDYRELTTDNKYELNINNHIVVAIDYTCIKIIVTFIQILYRDTHILELEPLKNALIGKYAILQKWVHLHKVQQLKKDAVTDPQAKTQIATLMDTGLFVKVDDQIAATTIEIVAILNNLLFACQSNISELILANMIGKANRESVLKIYREFAWLHPNKPRLEFKNMVESVIYNQQLIKDFIINEHESYFKGEKTDTEKYTSNISYCTRYFKDEITDDTTQRFLKKLDSSQSGTPLTSFIFTDSIITNLIKYTRYFIKFITGPSLELKQSQAINVTFNLLLESIIVLYMQTRSQKLKSLFLQINSLPTLASNYTDYTKIIVQIILNYFNKKEEPAVTNRKEAARLKRDLKMKEMKEKQDKFLGEHCNSNTLQQKIQENQDLCIICKTPSTEEQHLNNLCNAHFSNTLNINILSTDKIMLVITTCGHKIHEKCLAQNIDQHDQYGINYHCFLCKQLSNLRIPVNLNNANIQTFLQYFLTIISVEMSANPSLQSKQKEYTSLTNLSKILYDSIVLSVYFYYFSIGKFYSAYMLPIVSAEITILKWLMKLYSVPKFVGSVCLDKKLKLIEEKVNEIINNQTNASNHSENLIGPEEKSEREDIDHLFKRAFDRSQPKFQEIKQLSRLNFLNLPKDLRTLIKQVGKCRFCKHYNNKTYLCFLCGFKSCADCNSQINTHIDTHLGTSVFIDVQSGRYAYRYRNIQVSYQSLYINYIGEQYTDDQELPPKGEYELSQQRLQKLIDEILKDKIQSTVEEQVRQAESIPACNIQ